MELAERLRRPDPFLVDCIQCNRRQPLDEFRMFLAKPELYFDFCRDCEHRHGTMFLYRRFASWATPEILKAVQLADSIPANRRAPEQLRLLIEPTKPKSPDRVATPEERQQLVLKELAQRRLSRERLIYFTKQFQPSYLAGWVHNDLARRLEKFLDDVVAGKSPRMMVFMPPRSGKSTLVSDMFPSWVLGHHPTFDIILTSYAQSLPIKWSRYIRDRMEDPKFQELFPDCRIRKDSRNVEEWTLTAGGVFVTAGVGGGITGKGGHILIIDDPVKDQEEAQSEIVRQKTYEWYQTTLASRTAPGAGILVCMTRWHDADLAGALLNDRDALIRAGVPEDEIDNWQVVTYPAMATDDEYLMTSGDIYVGSNPDEANVVRLLRHKNDALHPARYDEKWWARRKNSTPPSVWNALYQQNPVPDEGEFFTKSMLLRRNLDENAMKHVKLLQAWDLAIGKKQRNDWTVGVVGALDSNDDLYILAMVRRRMGSLEIIDAMDDFIAAYPGSLFGAEKGHLEAAILPILKPRLAQKRRMVTFTDDMQPIQDKEIRARPLQSRLQQGKLFFPENASWYPDVVAEMLRFPNGVHDDIVDALAWLAQLAARTSAPQSPIKIAKQKSWRDELVHIGRQATSYMAS